MTRALEKVSWIIGSDIKCDVHVPDKRIATQHALLVRKDTKWLIQPLDGMVTISGKQVFDATVIEAPDDVQLTNTMSLPWPSAEGAAAVYTIGRSPECDIVLNSPNISAQHAILIVGKRGTYVLLDTESTNGLFLGPVPTERIHGLVIEPTMKIFFGSTAVLASELLDASERIRPSALIAVSFPQSSLAVEHRESGKGLSHAPEVEVRAIPKDRCASKARWHKIAINALFLPISIVLAYSVLGPDGLQLTSNGDTQKQEAPSSRSGEPPQRDSPPAIAESTATRSLPPRVNSSASLPLVPDATPSSSPEGDVKKSRTLNDGLFWIVVEKKSDKTTYRTGTAVAISPNRVLTTAAIIVATEQLQRSIEGVMHLVHVSSGKHQTILASGVHPEFKKRLMISMQTREQRDAENDVTDEERERLATLVNVSLESVSAVDVGWMETTEIATMVPLGLDLSLRPRQEMTAILSGFPMDDPYFDPAEERSFSSSPFVVRGFGTEMEGYEGAIQLTALNVPSGMNIFGCPIVVSGKLAGIVCYSGNDPESDNILIESVSPKVIRDFIETIGLP